MIHNDQMTNLALAFSSSLAFILLVLAAWWLKRNLEQRQRLEEMAQCNQALEAQVAQHTAELIALQQALSARTLQLEAVNRELKSFSYSISHDLRTPWRHIGGFLEVLSHELEATDAASNARVDHYLQVIRESNQKMGELINGLLALSQVGSQALNVRPVDLQKLVEQVIASIQSRLTKEGRTVDFTLDPLPTVMGDTELLRQVWSHLIDNAIKFTRDVDPSKIVIGTLENGTLFIQDNGIGFPMQYADQVFGIFQRLHSSTEFAGSGIGLAIAQRIIHRHGGTIWAESAPNQGANFYFTLGQVLET